MNTSERPPTPTVEQIDSQVRDICNHLEFFDEGDLFWYLIHRDREPSAKMAKVYDVAMEYLAWRKDGGTIFQNISFKDRYTHKTLPNPKAKESESEAAKARSSARDLRAKLLEYYKTKFEMLPHSHTRRDPHPREVKAGRAEWVLYIEIPKARGWKPIIEFRTRAITQSVETHADRFEVERIGTNIDAMKYLATHIPLAIRIEDTAIRWDSNKLPYADPSEVKAAIKQSTAHYVLITGAIKNKTYMEAIKEAFRNRPKESGKLECFRLDRSVPIMNFVILHYLDRPTEVLFGYGIRQGKNSLDGTTVFKTHNPTLVKEYMRLFEAFRNHASSHPISIDDPDFADSDESECDVVATVEKFGDVSIENLLKKEPCGKVRICFPCSSEIERLIAPLKRGSTTNSIQVLLAHKDSDFLKIREQAISRSLQKKVDHNLEALKGLLPRRDFEVRLTRKSMPVMFIQIGDTIIFSAFWNGQSVAMGPQCIVRSSSKTGIFLEKQFEELWKDEGNELVDYSKELPPSVQSADVMPANNVLTV